MKKAIVAAMVLIVGIVLAIPFASGLIMEKTVRNAFKNVNSIYAATGTGYSLEIVDYRRGYLTSDIEWKIDLGPFKAIYHIDDIVFKDHARHGLNGVVSTTSLGMNPWYAEFVQEKLQGRDPLHITTRYSLMGSIETTTALDAFSAVVDDQRLDVHPGSMVMTTDYHLEDFTSSGSWAGMAAGEQLVVGKTSMASKLKMLSTFLWDGKLRFDIQDVRAQGKGTPFELRNMNAEYVLAADNDQSTLSGEVSLSITAMHAKDIAIDNASVRLATNGLDIQGYEDFMRMYTQNVSQIVAGMAAMEDNSAAAEEAMKKQIVAMGFQMMAAYEKILREGLEFKISDLHATLAQGEIHGEMTLKLLKDMTLIQFIPIANHPELLFDILYLKSELSLPGSLAEDDPRLITPLYPGMQTGIFVKDGDNLVHQAETVNGKLILNRSEVILPGQDSV